MMEQTTGTDLVTIESLNAVEIFSSPGGLDPILDHIEKEVSSLILDASTHKGREEIRSTAYKVKKSRTALFKMAKDLTEDWREQTKKVTAERNRMEERLVKLEEDVRQPLTEFENKEKNRVQAHEDAMLAITLLGEAPKDIQVIESAITTIDADARDWEEFTDRARRTKETVREVLSENLRALKKAAEEAAELARLRKAEEERLRKEREEKIASEAAENARIEAEKVAKEAADKAEAERLRIEADLAKAKKDAGDLAAKVEADRIAAAEKAKKDAEAAAQAERDKIAAQQKAEKEATEKREADLAHKKKINNEAKDALITQLSMDGLVTINPAQAEAIVKAIAKGQIPHVRISY